MNPVKEQDVIITSDRLCHVLRQLLIIFVNNESRIVMIKPTENNQIGYNLDERLDHIAYMFNVRTAGKAYENFIVNAKLFHQVVEEFKYDFWLIDFAILDGYKTGLRHNPEGNLLPFQREFKAL